jgi:hypothetical protein
MNVLFDDKIGDSLTSIQKLIAWWAKQREKLHLLEGDRFSTESGLSLPLLYVESFCPLKKRSISSLFTVL